LKSTESEPKASKDYKEFLKNYFGHMAVTSKKDAPTVSLLLESKAMPLTFQGGPLSNAIFTSDSKVMYPEMNRVAVVLKYRGEAPNFQKLVQKLKINSDDDLKKNMGAFAVEPKFTATLFEVGPWFDYFEYRNSKDGRWTKLNGKTVDWDAVKKLNVFEARAVNKFGRPGPITFLEVSYK
jgi:hypothetical protein